MASCLCRFGRAQSCPSANRSFDRLCSIIKTRYPSLFNLGGSTPLARVKYAPREHCEASGKQTGSAQGNRQDQRKQGAKAGKEGKDQKTASKKHKRSASKQQEPVSSEPRDISDAIIESLLDGEAYYHGQRFVRGHWEGEYSPDVIDHLYHTGELITPDSVSSSSAADPDCEGVMPNQEEHAAAIRRGRKPQPRWRPSRSASPPGSSAPAAPPATSPSSTGGAPQAATATRQRRPLFGGDSDSTDGLDEAEEGEEAAEAGARAPAPRPSPPAAPRSAPRRPCRLFVLWDLDNKYPVVLDHEGVVLNMREALSRFGPVAHIHAFANHVTLKHVPKLWDEAMEAGMEHPLAADEPEELRCPLCGYRARDEAKLQKHFTQLHAREHQKRLRYQPGAGKYRQSGKHERYQSAVREVLPRRRGFDLAGILVRAGVQVTPVQVGPQRADVALERAARELLAREQVPPPGSDPSSAPRPMLVLVSDDHGFEPLLKLFASRGWGTAAVSNNPLRGADEWLDWQEVVMP